MVKAVLGSRIRSDYDDLREERFHFRKNRGNWEKAHQIVGDWIIYYEPWTSGIDTLPRPIGRQAYFALAQVDSVEPDPVTDTHAYLKIKNYLNFETDVPYRINGKAIEASLFDEDGNQSNVFRHGIRIIPDDEFWIILKLGYPSQPNLNDLLAVGEQAATFRPWVPQKRTTRSVYFRSQVVQAYSGTCAVSRMHLLDTDSNPEAEAIHIRPPSAGGADVVRNGLALSGTIGWMFRRGLFTLSDDLKIIHHGQLPDQLSAMFQNNYAMPPKDTQDRPHPRNLAFHREHIFGRGFPLGFEDPD